jgi:hypothetical protein
VYTRTVANALQRGYCRMMPLKIMMRGLTRP